MWMASNDTVSSVQAKPPDFITTHWSFVMAVGHNDTSRAQLGLEYFCRVDWWPGMGAQDGRSEIFNCYW